MAYHRTPIFQLDGQDVVSGELVKVKNTPHCSDGFIAVVMHGEFDDEGNLYSVTVYGGPSGYGAARTFLADRFEPMTSKFQEIQRAAFDKAQQKMYEKLEKERVKERRSK